MPRMSGYGYFGNAQEKCEIAFQCLRADAVAFVFGEKNGLRYLKGHGKDLFSFCNSWRVNANIAKIKWNDYLDILDRLIAQIPHSIKATGKHDFIGGVFAEVMCPCCMFSECGSSPSRPVAPPPHAEQDPRNLIKSAQGRK